MNAIFYNDDTLSFYEKESLWEESVLFLNALLSRQPDNKSILCRFAAQCWYVLTVWDYNMPTENLNKSVFEDGLKKAYGLTKERWWTDSDCLWLFGYFMYINQMAFSFVDVGFNDIENEGVNLISRSYYINPHNQLAEVLFLGIKGDSRKYSKAKKALNKCIHLYFPQQSAVEHYFTEVFTWNEC